MKHYLDVLSFCLLFIYSFILVKSSLLSENIFEKYSLSTTSFTLSKLIEDCSDCSDLLADDLLLATLSKCNLNINNVGELFSRSLKKCAIFDATSHF
jgi:hypothetical protein